MRAIGLALAIAALTGGCGGVECGEGTFRDGDNCIGYDPNDQTPPVVTLDPPARRSRDPIPATVSLTTDEAARIFFTTDGSDPDPSSPGEVSPVVVVDVANGMTLKYFAIDRAGNQSAIETATYVSDIVAPARVSNLVVTPGAPNATDATITWVNPTDADFAGVIVARVADVVDGAPEGGVSYTAQMAITPSLTVLHVGQVTDTQFIDTNVPPGRVRYVVWTFDDLANYGQPRGARADMPFGTLDLEFTYDNANGTLTPTVTSPAIDTTGTSASGAGTVTLSLSLKNVSTTYFQNPKALVPAPTNATFGTTNPTADGLSFVDLGPATLAPNATVTRTLQFTGVSGVATFRIRLGHHASLMLSRSSRSRELAFIDSGAVFTTASQVRETPRFTTLAVGPNGRGSIRPALFVGEHFVDVPTQHGTIERWDTVTQTRVASTDISAQGGDRVNVQAAIADSANIYVLVKTGRTRDIGKLTVIRLDEGLRETGRLDLASIDGQGFTHPVLSPDETTLAIPSDKDILLIDTDTLTQRSVISTNLPDRIRALTYFDAGNGLLAVARTGGRAEAIRLAPALTSTDLTEGNNSRGHSVALAPDGRVFVAFDNSVRVYNPVTDQMTSTAYTGGSHGVMVLGTQLRSIKASNRTQIDFADPTTGAIQTTKNVGFNAVGHWLGFTSR
jgi:hypothetical protein